MAKVLIVDDAAFMRAIIRKSLENNGYDVIGEAGNGQQGYLKYKELRPDIVTMDITMPEMSGIEALKEIRKIDPKAKVIMVSAMGQEELVKEAVVNGAISFIVKPFQENHLLMTMSKISDRK